MFKAQRESRQKAQATGQSTAVETGATGISISAPKRCLRLRLSCLLAVALWQSRNFGYRAGLFPWVIGIPTLILALAQLARDLYGRTKKTAGGLAEAVEIHVDIAPQLVRKRTISILCWTVGFFLAIWLLGFSYAVPLTIFLYLKFAGKEKWPMTIAVTFFSWLFYWSLFEKLLNVPFPDGYLISLFRGPQ